MGARDLSVDIVCTAWIVYLTLLNLHCQVTLRLGNAVRLLMLDVHGMITQDSMRLLVESTGCALAQGLLVFRLASKQA